VAFDYSLAAVFCMALNDLCGRIRKYSRDNGTKQQADGHAIVTTRELRALFFSLINWYSLGGNSGGNHE